MFLSLLQLTKTLDDPIRAALQDRADHWLNLLGWSTRLVLIGIAVEGIEYAVAIGAWLVRQVKLRRDRQFLKKVNEIFPAYEGSSKEHGEFHLPTWAKFVVFIGLVLVVVGVGGELKFEHKLEVADGDIQSLDNERLTAARKEAGDAKESANGAALAAANAMASAKGAAKAAFEATASAAELKKYLAQLATPRDIVLSDRDGDHEVRAARFAEVKKYSGTLAVIQWIPEFESLTYMRHLAAALNQCGWKVELTTPQESHIPYEFISEGVKVVTLEESFLEPGDISSAQPKRAIPPKSKAFAPAAALVKLLDLDLGPPFGPAYFGVHWEAEWNDSRFSSFTKRGFVFPDGAVLILVGTKPAEYAAHIHKKQKKHDAKP